MVARVTIAGNAVGEGRSGIFQGKSGEHRESIVLEREVAQGVVRYTGVKERAIFGGLQGAGAIAEPLHPDGVADIYKQMVRWIGMSQKQGLQVSDHSIRVGLALDRRALNVHLRSIKRRSSVAAALYSCAIQGKPHRIQSRYCQSR
jgi:hypothetical protein